MTGSSGRSRRRISEFTFLMFEQDLTSVAHRYHAFFAHVDSFRGDQFLYLTSVGVPAAGSTAASKDKAEAEDARAALDSGSEGDARGQEEG